MPRQLHNTTPPKEKNSLHVGEFSAEDRLRQLETRST